MRMTAKAKKYGTGSPERIEEMQRIQDETEMPDKRQERQDKWQKKPKTNAMRMLDRQKVKYEAFAYDCG